MPAGCGRSCLLHPAGEDVDEKQLAGGEARKIGCNSLELLWKPFSSSGGRGDGWAEKSHKKQD